MLERFLRCAETWAELIVIIDQASDDGSREIASSHPKVHLIDYPGHDYDDETRRGILIDTARALVPGPRTLVALDADEALATDVWEQPEWQTLLAAAPGTVGQLQWINILPEEPRAWIPHDRTDIVFIDDDSEFHGLPMHGPRLPAPPGGTILTPDAPKVLHLQYLDWDRMRSKQRWYQAQDRLVYPRRRPIQIYRQYHFMDAIDPTERHPLKVEWLAGYDRIGVDLLAIERRAYYPTDTRVLDLLLKHGQRRFRRVALWDVDWSACAQAVGRTLPADFKRDPRSRLERAVFRWLAATQRRMLERRIRWIQRALRLLDF